jgi:predicted transposase/invertase (TIGR01784 family)
LNSELPPPQYIENPGGGPYYQIEKDHRRQEHMLMSEWKLEDALVVEREEGREEGLEEVRKEVVKSLLDYGMNLEQVSQALNLPPDMIAQYLN